MINLKVLLEKDFDYGMIYLKTGDPIQFDKDTKIEITDSELILKQENTLTKTHREDPGKNADIFNVVDLNLVIGFTTCKYNLIEKVPSGLIVSKGGQA